MVFFRTDELAEFIGFSKKITVTSKFLEHSLTIIQHNYFFRRVLCIDYSVELPNVVYSDIRVPRSWCFKGWFFECGRVYEFEKLIPGTKKRSSCLADS